MLGSAVLNLVILGWFVLIALGEGYCARRSGRNERTGDGRLLTNFGLGALILLTTMLFPIARLVAASTAQSLDTGLAPRLGLSWPLVLILLLLADSLAIYWTHRLMHRAPLLWRIHRVHHSDEGFDVSTSLRNHPLELLVAVPTLSLVVFIIGPPASVVVATQTIGLAVTIFQHADIELPGPVDRALALVLVTPRFHRVHHNPERQVHDSNYGELFTFWDRLFGTLIQPDGRGPVGLDAQVVPSDRLLQQIWSPVYGA